MKFHSHHFYDGNDNGNAKLMVRTDFGFANGWPYLGNPPSSGVYSGGVYRMTPRHSGKTLDVENCGTGAGTNVRQWSWYNNNCQKWIFTDAGSGYWRISPVNAPNMALDLENCSGSNLANIRLWNWYDNDCQKWELIDRGSGYYSIRSKASGKCFDIEGVSNADGANLFQYTCYSSSNNQQFYLENVGSSRMATQPKTVENDFFQVYPNPVEDRVNINLGKASLGVSEITLMNHLGQVIRKKQVEGSSCELSMVGLNRGFYLVQVKSSGGIQTIKIQKR